MQGPRRRRRLLLASAALAASRLAPPARAQAADAFDEALRALTAAPELVVAARRFGDYAEVEAAAECTTVVVDGMPSCVIARARRPRRLRPSRATISRRATELIVFCEVTSRARYEQGLDRPVWPRLGSGLTIGIGYDLGYVEERDFTAEWGPYLHPFTLRALTRALGRRGEEARQLAAELDHLRITWDDALRQFNEVTLPLFMAETERFCDNTDRLSEDSRGALVSLVINRGSSIGLGNDPEDRRREMREIRDLMAARRFAEVPDRILAMKRIWAGSPDARGLLLRREAEARLFRAGLG